LPIACAAFIAASGSGGFPFGPGCVILGRIAIKIELVDRWFGGGNDILMFPQFGFSPDAGVRRSIFGFGPICI
jgi:hypothetical protein